MDGPESDARGRGAARTRDVDPAKNAEELRRQEALVGALWGDAAAAGSLSRRVVADARVPAARGLQAYRANAGAAAERTLAAAFPVVRALVGAETFAGLSRAYWHDEPPHRGDLATLVEGLPGYIACDARLADVPYLADIARVEAALARAESAADARGSAAEQQASLRLLADRDPSQLVLDLAPGAGVVRSAWPVAAIWQAHAPDRDALAVEAARTAIAGHRAETVFVWRSGWKARIEVVDAASACFLEALVESTPLDEAHARAVDLDEGWRFEAWLGQALASGWLAGARQVPDAGRGAGMAPVSPGDAR